MTLREVALRRPVPSVARTGGPIVGKATAIGTANPAPCQQRLAPGLAPLSPEGRGGNPISRGSGRGPFLPILGRLGRRLPLRVVFIFGLVCTAPGTLTTSQTYTTEHIPRPREKMA